MPSADISRAEDELHSRLVLITAPEDIQVGIAVRAIDQPGGIQPDKSSQIDVTFKKSLKARAPTTLIDQAAADFSAVPARLLSSARGEGVTVKTS